MANSPLTMEIDKAAFVDMRKAVAQISVRLTDNAARRGMRKAMAQIAGQLKRNTPKATKIVDGKEVSNKAKAAKDKRHMADTVNYKVKTYSGGKRKRVFGMVGYESPQVHHAHLVEYGTAPRYTKHSTEYERVLANRKVKYKRGGYRYRKTQKRSIGSFRDPKKRGPVLYRGIMPAFRPVQRTMSQTKGVIDNSIYDEMAAELKKMNKSGKGS